MSLRGASSESGRRSNRWRFDSEAVTPVVGTLLILSIVVVSMAGILAWGVPAIQGLQEHAEFQSVQTQMLELNSELRNLRDPQNTRVSTISIAGGNIQVTTGDRWVISAMAEGYGGFQLSNYKDDGNPQGVSVEGLPITGSTIEATFTKFVGRTPTLLDQKACVVNCDLQAPGTTFDVATDTGRVQITENSIVKAEAWIINVGRITYAQDGGRNYNHLEMGASLIQQGDGYYLRTSPTIKEPDFDTTVPDTDFFVRVLELKGVDQAVSGRGEFSILVNLVDNYGVSKERPSFEVVRFVRVQVFGEMEESFCNHFLSESPSYKFRGIGHGDTPPTTCADGDANVLYDPGVDFSFEMSQTEVNVYARST